MTTVYLLWGRSISSPHRPLARYEQSRPYLCDVSDGEIYEEGVAVNVERE